MEEDKMGPITIGLTMTALIFILLYFLIAGVVKKELQKEMPTQLQGLRDKLKGDLKVLLEVKEDGETKITDVETKRE